jgi:hypothetical protein
LNRAKTERDGGLGSKPQIAGGIGFFRELACQAAINHLIEVRSRFDSISFAQRPPTDKRAIGAPNFSRTTIYLARALHNNRYACAFSCPSRSAQPRSKAASLVCPSRSPSQPPPSPPWPALAQLDGVGKQPLEKSSSLNRPTPMLNAILRIQSLSDLGYAFASTIEMLLDQRV